MLNTTTISVLTITRNNLKGLKQTLKSVQSQILAATEIIVIDGASTDGSLEYLTTLGPEIKWVSEPDQGISDAFNKALKISTSEWVIFLNAGDSFAEENVLFEVSNILTTLPEQTGVCAGIVHYIDHLGMIRGQIKSAAKSLEKFSSMAHQASFIRRGLHLGVEFDVRLKNGMDYDVWLRLLKQTEFYCIDFLVANCEWGGISTAASSAIHSIILEESVRSINSSRDKKLGIKDVGRVFVQCVYVKLKLWIRSCIQRILP